MSLAAPSSESFSYYGCMPASAYRGVAMPAYAEVAAGSPGLGAVVQLCAELDDVMIDCHRPGWDGYGAEAVSVEAYELAQRFVRSLPAGIPRPLLSADPDGCVTFEWRVSPRRLVLVSVRPDYRIEYAALFGSAESHGTEPFFDKFPTRLRDLVRGVYQA